MTSERRAHQRQPIRLKVVYKTARNLVTEYTTSVSKGGCQLRAKKALPVGTRFVFEMYATGSKTPVNIDGQVLRSELGPDGLYDIGVRYLASEGEKAALAQMLDEIIAEQRFEKARRHPRIPVNLVARDVVILGRRYLVRDISRGGVGLRFPEGEPLPPGLSPGKGLALLVRIGEEPEVELPGQVVWRFAGRAGYAHAAAGVAFLELSGAPLAALDALCRLVRPSDLAIRLESPEG